MMTSQNHDFNEAELLEDHTRETAERANQEHDRKAAEQAARDAADAPRRAAALAAATARWMNWLTAIGVKTGLKFATRETGNEYRPVDLVVEGVRVPVQTGFGSSTTLEIHMPWYTAGYDSFRHKRLPVECCKSRMKKDGSFNYLALGSMAVAFVRATQAYARAEAAKMGAAGIVKLLIEELKYSHMEPSPDPAKPVRFKFSMNRDMTEPEARAAHAALVAAGLIKQK